MIKDSLAGRVCLVTGGAGGLGKEIVKILLKRGANVVICDINKDLLDAALHELSGEGNILSIESDVSNLDSVESMAKTIVKTYGQLDVLVNNAGVMDRFDPAGDLDKALWDKVLAINLTAPFLLTKCAVQHFLQRSATDAAIVNVGSLSSQCGFTAGAAYTASKHGLLGLTKNTAAFYKDKGIRCNLIMPGGMATNIVSAFANGTNEEGKRLVYGSMAATKAPLCSAEEVAQICAFLCSNASMSLNGVCIAADNGWTSMF